jgi:hypothetical protein
LPGTAGSFLAPGLFAAAGDFSPLFGVVCAEACIGQLAQERLVHQRTVDRGCKDGVAQLYFADLLPIHVF